MPGIIRSYKGAITATSILLFIVFFIRISSYSWGFYGHQLIARNAIFILPPEMLGFYKANFDKIIEGSIQPDIRRYVVEDEAPKHYIDLELYGEFQDSILYVGWKDALKMFGEDTLNARGILPWSILNTYYNLIDAFKVKNGSLIIRYSADLCHYISDAHVPLHTTYNYNGQYSGQEGIHRLWESLIPEAKAELYSFLVGRAVYVEDVYGRMRNLIMESHQKKDSVLQLEKSLSNEFNEDKQYSFQRRGKREVKLHSKEYVTAYEKRLDGMVERQLRSSVKLTGDLWLTCWIEAGQPDLDGITVSLVTKEELQRTNLDTAKVSKRTQLH